MISSSTLLIFSQQYSNKIVLDNAVSMMELDLTETKYKQERIDLLKRKSEIAVKDRNIFKWSLSFLFALGFYTSLYGFTKWKRDVQPIHDNILELQREKLKLEVDALNKECSAPLKAGADFDVMCLHEFEIKTQ